MSHLAFLSLIHELDVSPSANIDLEEGQLSVQKAEGEDAWLFSMKVADMEEEDRELLSCFFSSGLFRFSDRDVLLKWDPHTRALYAVQQVNLSWKHYLVFRSHLNNFLKIVSEYRNYLSVESIF